jgi:hypothetical protein
VEVPDKLLAIFEEFTRAEATYERKKYRYKAHYSLDRGYGIDTSTLNRKLSNYESKLREVELNKTRLENKIDSLPEDTRFRERSFLFQSKNWTNHFVYPTLLLTLFWVSLFANALMQYSKGFLWNKPLVITYTCSLK